MVSNRAAYWLSREEGGWGEGFTMQWQIFHFLPLYQMKNNFSQTCGFERLRISNRRIISGSCVVLDNNDFDVAGYSFHNHIFGDVTSVVS